VGGMPEEQNEALNESDLHQDVAEADGGEVEQPSDASWAGLDVSSGRSPVQDKRHDQKREHSDERQHQQKEQHDHADVDAPIHAAPGAAQDAAEHVAGADGEKEKWSVVGDGRDVVRVSREEVLPPVEEQRKFVGGVD